MKRWALSSARPEESSSIKPTREDSPASSDQSGVKLSSNPHPPVSELLAASNGQNTGISELEAAL